MSNLTKSLFGSVALCALMAVPAVSENADSSHMTALHGGRVINKTKLHNRGATHIYSTLSVFTYLPPSSYRKKQFLPGTFYKYVDACSVTKWKVTKKAQYGKVGFVTGTYTCDGVAKTVPIGNFYKLTDPDAEGKTDHFVSSVSAKFENNGTKYKGTLSLDVSVIIE
jgi:hypothetical protein